MIPLDCRSKSDLQILLAVRTFSVLTYFLSPLSLGGRLQMASTTHDNNQRLAKVVEQRAGVGQTEMVSGWQALLNDLLIRMKPFMKPGFLVTFQNLTESEITFFERLHHEVRIPQSAIGLYLPPSVRKQMLGENRINNDIAGQPDAGVVVASHYAAFDVIVNALFAFSPFTPAVDVYDRGRLMAGYQYATIDECRADLASVLDRYLGMPSTRG
jgi:hypothetical protein